MFPPKNEGVYFLYVFIWWWQMFFQVDENKKNDP